MENFRNSFSRIDIRLFQDYFYGIEKQSSFIAHGWASRDAREELYRNVPCCNTEHFRLIPVSSLSHEQKHPSAGDLENAHE